MTLKEYKQIIRALEALSMSEDAKITFCANLLGRVTVYVNGKEFGIYDLHRDTFVN